MQQGFAAACQKFFGRHPGQGLKEFSEELQQLTKEDKEEIREGLIKNGFDVRPLDA